MIMEMKTKMYLFVVNNLLCYNNKLNSIPYSSIDDTVNYVYKPWVKRLDLNTSYDLHKIHLKVNKYVMSSFYSKIKPVFYW